jgi:hypothetical protein
MIIDIQAKIQTNDLIEEFCLDFIRYMDKRKMYDISLASPPPSPYLSLSPIYHFSPYIDLLHCYVLNNIYQIPQSKLFRFT